MTEPRVRHQTAAWLSAISTELRQTLQDDFTTLRTSIDERISALEKVFSRSDELFEKVTLQVHELAEEEVQTAATAAREQAEAAAQSEMGALRDRLHGELETMRIEFDATRTGLETQLAATERDIIAIRRKRDEHAASLEETRKSVDALEEASAHAASLRRVAEARLEEEFQRRTAVAKQLDAARQEIVLAKAEAESCRIEAHLAAERIGALEAHLQRAQAAAQMAASEPTDGSSSDVLGQLREALDDLGRARSDEILSMLVERLRRIFTAVAVFALTPRGLTPWRGRAGDDAAALPTQIPSLESESPLALAFRQRAVVSVTSGTEDAAVGLWETPLGHAIALPVVVNERVVAMAYAENPPGHADDLARVLDAMAEALVCCVNQRLQLKSPPTTAVEPAAELEVAPQDAIAGASTETDPYAVSRQARRVKMNSGVEVLVDGITAALVDVSALGAQVVSPSALRPNRVVRIQLPCDRGPLTCEGRIVWAQLESPGSEMPVYRAGVRFAQIDPLAITTFISQHAPAHASAPALT